VSMNLKSTPMKPALALLAPLLRASLAVRAERDTETRNED